MATNYDKNIERVSSEALGVLEKIATSAEAQLRESYTMGPTALASVNTFTSGEAIRTLSGIDGAKRHSLESQAKEPAIARVVARTDDQNIVIYYITRDTPYASLDRGMKLAGRNAPAGRIAALSVGDDFEIGSISDVIIEKGVTSPTPSRRRLGFAQLDP